MPYKEPTYIVKCVNCGSEDIDVIEYRVEHPSNALGSEGRQRMNQHGLIMSKFAEVKPRTVQCNKCYIKFPVEILHHNKKMLFDSLSIAFKSLITVMTMNSERIKDEHLSGQYPNWHTAEYIMLIISSLINDQKCSNLIQLGHALGQYADAIKVAGEKMMKVVDE